MSKYKFSWELLGDLEAGRPFLGNEVRVEVYRLMQYCFRDVLEKQFGSDVADKVFYDAGKLAGIEFYKNMIGNPKDLNEYVKTLQSMLKDLKIGVLRVEKADIENGEFVLTVNEDLDCSGLPEIGYEVCTYDEGFISGLMESYTGDKFEVKEVDCWCTGDRTCRFVAKAIKE